MTEDWLEFLEINIIVFMCDIFEYIMFANDATGLSSALSCIAVCGFILFTNSILLIIGLAIKNKSIQKIDETSDENEKNDENEKKSNKTSFLRVSMIILVCNLLIIFLVPIFTKQGTTNKVEDKVLNYLEQKYGNGNFKIVNVMKNYITNGFDKSLKTYYYEIKSDYMQNTFIVSIENDYFYINDDYFLPVYYSEKCNLRYELHCNRVLNSVEVKYDFDKFDKYIANSIKDIYSIEIEREKVKDLYKAYMKQDIGTKRSFRSIIPKDYGKIPSINELDELLVKYFNKQ